MQVFGKEDSFDPRTDPIVRVQARRLRAKLVRYYREEGPRRRGDHRAAEGRLRAGVQAARHAGSGRSGRSAPRSSAATPSRVLPFADHSVEHDLDYFCRGVRDEIVHHLSRFSSLRILASDDRGRPATRPTRRMIISGSVRRVRRASSHHRAADRRRDRLLPLVRVGRCRHRRRVRGAGTCRRGDRQEARAGARRRAARLGGSRRPSENLAAHNLYLQGRYHLNQRTEEGLRKALDFFEKALVEDARVRAGARRARRRVRPAGPLRRVRAGGGLDEGRVQRRDRGDARRRLRRGTHVARARASRRRTGTGPAPSASFSARSAWIRATRPRITGTRCRAWRRSAGSTKRSTR